MKRNTSSGSQGPNKKEPTQSNTAAVFSGLSGLSGFILYQPTMGLFEIASHWYDTDRVKDPEVGFLTRALGFPGDVTAAVRFIRLDLNLAVVEVRALDMTQARYFTIDTDNDSKEITRKIYDNTYCHDERVRQFNEFKEGVKEGLKGWEGAGKFIGLIESALKAEDSVTHVKLLHDVLIAAGLAKPVERSTAKETEAASELSYSLQGLSI
jgi:hypothetical protein